jgi:hypothetical protein
MSLESLFDAVEDWVSMKQIQLEYRDASKTLHQDYGLQKEWTKELRRKLSREHSINGTSVASWEHCEIAACIAIFRIDVLSSHGADAKSLAEFKWLTQMNISKHLDEGRIAKHIFKNYLSEYLARFDFLDSELPSSQRHLLRYTLKE